MKRTLSFCLCLLVTVTTIMEEVIINLYICCMNTKRVAVGYRRGVLLLPFQRYTPDDITATTIEKVPNCRRAGRTEFKSVIGAMETYFKSSPRSIARSMTSACSAPTPITRPGVKTMLDLERSQSPWWVRASCPAGVGHLYYAGIQRLWF